MRTRSIVVPAACGAVLAFVAGWTSADTPKPADGAAPAKAQAGIVYDPLDFQALQRKESDLAALEELTTALRREIFADVRIALDRPLKVADEEAHAAKDALEKAEIALRVFEKTEAPAEIEMDETNIRRSEAALKATRQKLAALEAKGARPSSPSERYAAKLAVDRAEFELQQAKYKLEVFNKYEQAKRSSELKAAIETARAALAEKEQALTEAKAVAATRGRPDPSKFREPDKYVVAALDEVVARQDRIAAELRKVEELQKALAAPGAKVDEIKARVKGVRDEIASLTAAQTEQLRETIALAERLKDRRALLASTEEELRKTRIGIRLLREKLGKVPPVPAPK